jgi:hypothetical protein
MSNEIIVRRWWDDTAEKRVVDHPDWYGPIGIIDFWTESSLLWPVWGRDAVLGDFANPLSGGPGQLGLRLCCLNADTDPVAPPVTTDQLLERLQRGENFPIYTGTVKWRDYGTYADPDDLWLEWPTVNPDIYTWFDPWQAPTLMGTDLESLIGSHYIMGNGGMFRYESATQRNWDPVVVWGDPDVDNGDPNSLMFVSYEEHTENEIYWNILTQYVQATCLASICVNLGKAVEDFRSSVISYEVRGSLYHVDKIDLDPQRAPPLNKTTVSFGGGYTGDSPGVPLVCRVRLFYPKKNEDGSRVEYGQDWTYANAYGTSGLLTLPENYELLTEDFFEIDWASTEVPIDTLIPGPSALDKDGWWKVLGYIDIDSGVSIESLYTNRFNWFSGSPSSKAIIGAKPNRREQRAKIIPKRPKVTWRPA